MKPIYLVAVMALFYIAPTTVHSQNYIQAKAPLRQSPYIELPKY
jgi:hypothetical protein